MPNHEIKVTNGTSKEIPAETLSKPEQLRKMSKECNKTFLKGKAKVFEEAANFLEKHGEEATTLHFKNKQTEYARRFMTEYVMACKEIIQLVRK